MSRDEDMHAVRAYKALEVVDDGKPGEEEARVLAEEYRWIVAQYYALKRAYMEEHESYDRCGDLSCIYHGEANEKKMEKERGLLDL